MAVPLGEYTVTDDTVTEDSDRRQSQADYPVTRGLIRPEVAILG